MISLETQSRPWTPILASSERAGALAAVDAIAAAILRQPGLVAFNPNVSGGAAGAALLFAFLARSEPENAESNIGHALDFLGRSAEMLARRGLQSPALYGGFTGIAWATELCREFIEDEDPSSEIDEALAQYLAQQPWRADYDVVQGLAGYALYALERNNAPLLESVVERLSETAVQTPQGTTWFTSPNLLYPWQLEKYPQGYYNLGLAHGVPGVIAVLAQACALGVAVEKARPLLDGAVRWMLSHELQGNNGACRFPSTVLHHDDPSGPLTRVSWCYGDLGIALALLWAARSVGEPEWEWKALELARHTAERPIAQAGTMDAGLCHGAAGNAHLFNRLYQATRDPLFLEAARNWIAKTMSYRLPNGGVGNFQAWRHDEGWQDTPGLLEGSIGIALALLAASSTVEPDWDRMLLVSVPPR